MFCGKCGKQIPDEDEFCMYCGSKIETTNEILITKTKKANKKVLFILIPIIIILVIGLVFLLKNSFMVDKGYLQNAAWGMTVEQVEKSQKTEPIGEYKDHQLMYNLTDIEGINGLNGFILYEFDESDNLKSGSLYLLTDNGNFDTNKVCDDMVTIYDKRYGTKHEKSTSYSYKWTTSNSIIEMLIVTENIVAINFNELK